VWRRLLILNLLLAPVWAIGQTNADGYFHKGAQYYIFGEKTNAMRAIYTGLRSYPTDPKLLAVAKLLRKKEEQSKPKSGQQNQQQNQDQKDQKNQKQQDKKSEQQKKDEEKARQEQAKKEQEKKEQQAEANQGEQKDKKDKKGEETNAAELHMSPEEARKLLDAQNDAKVLLFAPTNQPVNTQRGKFKDW
jgi:hypothetical protein